MAALTAALVGLAAASTISTLRSKGPKAPTPAELPPPPNVALDAQVADAARTRAETAQRTRAGGAYGRGATLLTGPGGITAPAPVQRKSLLGQ